MLCLKGNAGASNCTSPACPKAIEGNEIAKAQTISAGKKLNFFVLIFRSLEMQADGDEILGKNSGIIGQLRRSHRWHAPHFDMAEDLLNTR